MIHHVRFLSTLYGTSLSRPIRAYHIVKQSIYQSIRSFGTHKQSIHPSVNQPPNPPTDSSQKPLSSYQIPLARMNQPVDQSVEGPYVGGLDVGTSSVRFVLFDRSGALVDSDQIELLIDHHPVNAGWSQQSPLSLVTASEQCIERVMARHPHKRVASIGITNQRESTVIWNRATGLPLHDSIVWHDSRTKQLCQSLIERFGSINHWRSITGLPISTYFSAFKLHWLLHIAPTLEPQEAISFNAAAFNQSIHDGTMMFGTVDSWLVWNLTGGVDGGVHITDVSNASRTALMDLKHACWSPEICAALSIPMQLLPKIKSSSEVYGTIWRGALKGVPIAGILGDQQAALLGQLAVNVGDTKNTYGTGCFMLQNTGTQPVISKQGLLTTVAYQLGSDAPVHYALEGSVSVAGSGVRWLREQMGLIRTFDEINERARAVDDSGGLYFVPAFSGLLSPYYVDDARGLLIGLTHSSNANHFCRAVLEASSYQTAVILKAMYEDSAIPLTELRVDGGLSKSDLLLQHQADIANCTVIRPHMIECTAAGAAYAAGLAVGVWSDLDELQKCVAATMHPSVFHSQMREQRRARLMRGWEKAVSRAIEWVDDDALAEEEYRLTRCRSGEPTDPLPSKL